jgi:hypothetical protein
MRWNPSNGGAGKNKHSRTIGGVALASVVATFVACSSVDTVPEDGVTSPDAATTSTASGTNTAPTGTLDSGSSIDAASNDATLDAVSDATSDASLDGGADGDAPDSGAVPVKPGSDGVLRGLVSGVRTQEWVGRIRLPNATCPAGFTTVTSGAISCCAFAGNFGSVVRVPVVFDLTTRSGTLAGAPIGPFAAPVVEADGTMRFRAAAFLEGPKAWKAGIAMASANAAPAADIAEATRLSAPPALMSAISDSLKYLVLTWNPTTQAFRVRFDLTNYQATATGTCGIPGGQETSARLQFDLN